VAEGGVAAVVARRRAEQAAAVEAARRYGAGLPAELGVVGVVVFGSYARGDFNTWSDIDVLVVAEGLPPGRRARDDLLWSRRPDGVWPVGWTVAELAEHRRRRDPIAVEAGAVGITVAGALPPEPPRPPGR